MKKLRSDMLAAVSASMTNASDEPVLTPDDLEIRYKIPKSTQAKGRMNGNFCPYIKRGRNVYYLKSDVDKWLASLRRRHTSDRGEQAAA